MRIRWTRTCHLFLRANTRPRPSPAIALGRFFRLTITNICHQYYLFALIALCSFWRLWKCAYCFRRSIDHFCRRLSRTWLVWWAERIYWKSRSYTFTALCLFRRLWLCVWGGTSCFQESCYHNWGLGRQTSQIRLIK